MKQGRLIKGPKKMPPHDVPDEKRPLHVQSSPGGHCPRPSIKASWPEAYRLSAKKGK